MKYAILLVNILLLLLIVKVLFFDPISDTNSLFSLFVFIFMVFYNTYVVILYQMLKQNKNNYLNDILFYIFFMLPIVLLFYFMS